MSPSSLRKGRNDLFAGGLRGGRMRLRLLPPEARLFISPWDATLPDFVAAEPRGEWGAVLVVNATAGWFDAAWSLGN